MGTWADGVWGNDSAADWAYQFEKCDVESGLELLTDALTTSDSIEESAFGPAAWTLAVLLGWDPPKSAYGEDARAWAKRHRGTPVEGEILEQSVERIERALLEFVEEEEGEPDLDALWDADLEAPGWAHQLYEARAAILEAQA